MTFGEYQAEALRTSQAEPVGERLLVQALGLCGEAGEVADLMKKQAWHGRRVTADEMRDELSDVLWYVAELASAYGLNLDDVAAHNVEKLRRRYPNGFTADGGVRV